MFDFSNGLLMEELCSISMYCVYTPFPFLLVFCLCCVADEFKAFYTRLPQNYFLNVSTIQHLWSLDAAFQGRYEQLEASMRLLSRRAQRVIFKLFSLSKRCNRQPEIHLPRERSAQTGRVCVCMSRLPV